MTNEENSDKTKLEEYIDLSKNSLIRVQYSCSGNDNSIVEPEFIPIVIEDTDLQKSENEDETKIP